MASRRSMHKMKFREESSTSSRRKSRGIERKEKRENEMNKRRFLSDDMSPVSEDSRYQDDDKPGKSVRQKATSRLDRLKQWREERKRKTEIDKKDIEKPLFKVSRPQYRGESGLYKKQVLDMKPDTRNSKNKLTKTSVTNTSNKTDPEALKKTVVPTKTQAIKHQVKTHNPAPASQHTRVTRSSRLQASKEIVKTSTVTEAYVGADVLAVKADARRRGGKPTDLSSKMTASAAAKAKTNLDKPREFLRAKSKVMGTAIQNKKSEQKKNGGRETKKKEMSPTVKADVVNQEHGHEDCATSSESDYKELHLSDSGVATPKHSTPAPKRSLKKGSTKAYSQQRTHSANRRSRRLMNLAALETSREHLSAIDGGDNRGKEGDDEVEILSLGKKTLEYDLSKEEELVCGVDCDKADTPCTVIVAGDDEKVRDSERSVKRKNRRSALITKKTKRSSKKLSRNSSFEDLEAEAVNKLELSNKENVACEEVGEQKSRKSVTRVTLDTNGWAELRRKSQRMSTVISEEVGGIKITDSLTPAINRTRRGSRSVGHLVSFADDDKGISVQNSTTPNTGKRYRRLTVDTDSSQAANEMYPVVEHADVDDTQVPVIEYDTPVSQQRSRMSSALAKRRSVRIGSSTSVTFSDTISKDDSVEAVQYPRTPGPRYHRSTRGRSLAQQDHKPFVSANDEGTSDVIENNADDFGSQVTVDNKQQFEKSGKRRSTVYTSEIIDVSDEGTALSSGLDPGVVYHVGRPALSEPTSRALQELVVEKFDGEVSFVEVPLDDSCDIRVNVETVSLLKPLTVSDLDDQAVLEDAKPSSEENSLSTQPFTPRRSADTSSAVFSAVSSDTSETQRGALSATPGRYKRHSTTSSPFKTPGHPSSALLTRSQRKRRRTENSTPLKSPEEMIEILKNSPMIEMTRRKSRHIPSPELAVSSNFDALLAAASSSPLNSNSLVTLGTDSENDSLDASCSTESRPSSNLESETAAGKVKYFRSLLLSETDRLNKHCDTWNEVSREAAGLEEDTLGQIRSAVGKAQLLIDQRFKQFSSLIDNCEFRLGEKETTHADLQGFWDMIYFQVEDVDKLFSCLTEMKQNNWQVKEEAEVKNVPRKKVVRAAKPKVKSNFAAFRDEMMRRKLQAATAKTSLDEKPETAVATDPDAVTSDQKSVMSTPLKPVEPDLGQSDRNKQDSFTSLVEKSTGNLSSASQGNKENAVALGGRCLSMTPKQLRYVPVVPSPLLNDFTGLVVKKL